MNPSSLNALSSSTSSSLFIIINLAIIPLYFFIIIPGALSLLSLKTLKSVKSILIEISDDFLEQKNLCNKILKDFNFKQISKSNSEMFKGSKFENCYNQIWIKQ